MYCPKCKAAVGVHPSDNYCWDCGTKLVEYTPICQCGYRLSSPDNYCPKCGTKVQGKEAV
jgi:predicted amidophosphoribosyltransferase